MDPGRPGSAPIPPRSKVLLPLAGEALLRHTVRVFHELAGIAGVRVIARAEALAEFDRAFQDRAHWPRLGAWIPGGAERQDSVRLGLEALPADAEGRPDWVLVHDGARPLCSPGLIRRVLRALDTATAAVPVVPIFDTVRTAGSGGRSGGVVDRKGLRLAQTPQGFHWDVLRKAHQAAQEQGAVATDDGELVERMGEPVVLVPGERRNMKVTLPEDLDLAEWVVGHPNWGTEPAAV
jgi:2-C-methyl-D-erythritol 4-phosphate cytidylyltransferase